MYLNRINRVKFNDITDTPPVQKRIALARLAISKYPEGSTSSIPSNLTARMIAGKLSELERRRPCIYFSFGGDATLLIDGFGAKIAIGYDRRPMFDDSIESQLNGSTWDKFRAPLLEVLIEANKVREKINYLYNGYLSHFGEIGGFMLFDILRAGGTGLRIFKAEEDGDLFKTTFTIAGATSRIYYSRTEISRTMVSNWLADFLPGIVLIKAGEGGISSPYNALCAIADSFPDGSLVISDQELVAGKLKPLYPNIDNGYRSYGGSVSMGSLPAYRTEPTPFGYSKSSVFIYRVGE